MNMDYSTQAFVLSSKQNDLKYTFYVFGKIMSFHYREAEKMEKSYSSVKKKSIVNSGILLAVTWDSRGIVIIMMIGRCKYSVHE